MEKPQIIQCHHCGNNSPHEIIFKCDGPEEVLTNSEGDVFETVDTYYFLTRCKSCEDVSLFSDIELSMDLGNLNEAVLQYPKIKRYQDELPERIKKNYTQAKRIEKLSPISFAVMIRRCLEAVCIDKGASGKNLKTKLDDLAAKQIIPETLSRMSEALRYFGNIGAHATDDDDSVGGEEAKIMDEFFTSIIEYVYVAPAKIQKLNQRLAQKRKRKLKENES
ncbi:MAG: DUF4145 domain-containing protein [Patescibacteria group bacterium]